MIRRRTGFTLAEMLVTCAVLAIAAVVTLPSSKPVVEFRATAAVGEVARALRFAREEAMRSGALRMLRCNTSSNTVSVYIPDASGNVATAVNDPLTKSSYTVALGQAPAGSGAALSTCSFVFADKTTASTLAFDANGNPVRGTGAAKDMVQALSTATIQLAVGNTVRTIAVDITGRVSSS